jgi:hypothetical protein
MVKFKTMKGIYLTEEGKKEIEAKIAELEQFSPIDTFEDYTNFGKKQQLKEILSSATILPVGESWDTVEFSYDSPLEDLEETYPNGVIIQPKQQNT